MFSILKTLSWGISEKLFNNKKVRLFQYPQITRIERQKEKIKKPIIQCDIKGNYINEFDSINDAANSLHILACNISNCLKGRQKSTPRGLYTWKYKF